MGKEHVKGGAGPHNWGSLMDERELEEAALDDEARELVQEGGELKWSLCGMLLFTDPPQQPRRRNNSPLVARLLCR